jgi:putative ABC transport system permease protein
MEIPLRKGRPFTEADTQASQRVVIVSEKLAQERWPGQDAIGKSLKMGGGDSEEPWLSVVGIAGNVLSQGPTSGFQAEVYVPYTQYPWIENPEHLVVRLMSNPTAITTAIRQEIARLDKDQPVSEITTLDQIAGEPVALQRMLMLLLGAFAGLALVLAAVGVYGVMSFSVAQRTHEIGVRMALGAEKGDMLRMVIAKGIRLAVRGTAIGLAGAFGLMRLLSSQLFGVKPTDPATFVTVALLLTCIALLACYIPARRATKVDPIVALRYE